MFDVHRVPTPPNPPIFKTVTLKGRVRGRENGPAVVYLGMCPETSLYEPGL